MGLVVSKKTVQNALLAATRALKPEAEQIESDLRESERVKMDETGCTVLKRRGQVWVAIGDDCVVIKVEMTRGREAMEKFGVDPNKPFTSDGYNVYDVFVNRQRCWAHILRESEHLALNGDPNRMLLYDLLAGVYHDAKVIAGCTDAEKQIDSLQARCRAISAEYTHLEIKFGTTLANATPDLFTFLRYPGMDPTNNECELMLRPIVIVKRIRKMIASLDGMGMFGTLMTCLLTWEKRGLDISEQLDRLL